MTDRMSTLGSFLWKITYLRLASSIDKGIKSTLFAAVDPRVREKREEFKGKYIDPPGKLGKASPASQDMERAKELKALSDERIKQWGIELGDV